MVCENKCTNDVKIIGYQNEDFLEHTKALHLSSCDTYIDHTYMRLIFVYAGWLLEKYIKKLKTNI